MLEFLIGKWQPIRGQTWAKHKVACSIVMSGSQLRLGRAGQKVKGSNPEPAKIFLLKSQLKCISFQLSYLNCSSITCVRCNICTITWVYVIDKRARAWAKPEKAFLTIPYLVLWKNVRVWAALSNLDWLTILTCCHHKCSLIKMIIIWACLCSCFTENLWVNKKPKGPGSSPAERGFIKGHEK